MSSLADRLVMIADRVALAEKWLAVGNPDQAADALAGVHDGLVALAEEVDR